MLFLKMMPDTRGFERPANTVVVAYGKDRDRYAVRSRIGCRNVDGRRVPVEGPIVGHIVDGKYVPIDGKARVSESPVDIKDWANIRFVQYCTADLLDGLCGVYHRDDALIRRSYARRRGSGTRGSGCTPSGTPPRRRPRKRP